MSIPRNTLEVIEEMAKVPEEEQIQVAQAARDALDRYLVLLIEETEREARWSGVPRG